MFRNKAIAVETVTAVATSNGAGSGPAVLNASGYVVARRQATVAAKVTGKVAEVMIEEGMNVKEGQIIARLDNSTSRPTYELAQRQLESARINLRETEVRLGEPERTLRRTEQLRTDKLVSESQLDTAQSDVAATRARLESLQSEVKVAEGTVACGRRSWMISWSAHRSLASIVSKDAQPGEMVSPISAGGGFTRTGIATIVDMESREIEVDVNESFINRVHNGQKTEAVLDAYPDWVIPSHVINIVPTADRQKATVRVRIGFDTLEPRILPDMGVKVSFLEDRGEPSTRRPRGPVGTPACHRLSSADGETVMCGACRTATVERVAVSTGGERDGQVEVLSGINAGDTVVATPVEGLKQGDSVKAKSS